MTRAAKASHRTIPASPETTVLLLGSGGRESALAWALSKSPRLKNLYALPGSSAISQWAQNMPGDPCNVQTVVAAAKSCHAKLVVVGPEAPLAAGVADALRKEGIAVFGPNRDAARLEASKSFAKDFMTRHEIPTARYEVFTEAWRARAAVEAKKLPFVIKADGLAAGKGVRIIKETNAGLGTVTEWMERGALGPAGKTLVVESCLEGPEASILMLVDGKDYRVLPPAQDHKRLLDDDQGPNTGGMGAFAPAPLDAATLGRIRTEVLDPVMVGLRAEGWDYRGVLYVGLMLTASGPKVLEFNARLGDPETQAVLPLLQDDFLELALACAHGKLGAGEVRVKPGACVCVTLASEGYPDKPVTGRKISGLDGAALRQICVFHAGTRLQDGTWLTSGGRVLSVTAHGPDLAAARDSAYAACQLIRFDGMQYRKDIAAKAPALR